jgi:hypothetical protein
MWRLGRADRRARTVRQIGGARLERSGKERRSSNGRSRRSIFGDRCSFEDVSQMAAHRRRSVARPTKENPATRAGLEESLRQSTRLRTAGAPWSTPGTAFSYRQVAAKANQHVVKKHPALSRVSCGRNRQAAQGTRSDPPGFAAQVCRLTAVRLPLRRRREPRSSRPVLGCR